MRTYLFCLILAISAAASAADRNAKIQALMEAQGLVAAFQQQIDLGKQYSNQQAQQMLEQFMGGLNPSSEFAARFRAAYNSFMKSLEVPWTSQEIVDVWAASYGKSFTDQELDDLVAFYKSPIGQKDVAASQKALPEVSAIFAERSKPIIERATGKYMQDLELIAKECNCRK